MVCTHAVMSDLKISVISPKTGHRFCYCFVLSSSIKRWPPPLAALKKIYVQLTSWLKVDNINSSCAPCLWLLILWWNSWDLSNLTLWFWTGYGGELASPFPCLPSPSPPPIPRHGWCIVARELPDLGGGSETRKGAKNRISYGLTWDWVNFLELLNMFYKILLHKEMICRKEPRNLSVLHH